MRFESLNPVGVPVVLGRAVTEGGEVHLYVAQFPGEDDPLVPLRLEYILEQAGAGGMETGEEDGRGDGIGLNASRVEGDKPVGRAEPERSIPGRKAGIGGENTGGDPVAGVEAFLAAVAQGVADDAGAGGEPKQTSVIGDSLYIFLVQNRFHVLLGNPRNAFLQAREHPLRCGKQAVDVIGRQPVINGVFLP